MGNPAVSLAYKPAMHTIMTGVWGIIPVRWEVTCAQAKMLGEVINASASMTRSHSHLWQESFMTDSTNNSRAAFSMIRQNLPALRKQSSNNGAVTGQTV